MNVLVTGARMPFAVDEIRKLGRRGHRVFASDTYWSSPGTHSRYVTEHLVTPTPRYETAAFVEYVGEVIRTRRIDLVVPAFEEALYLAKDRESLESRAPLFAPSFDLLLRLHGKHTLSELAREVGIPGPETHVVCSPAEFRRAASHVGTFVARPAFSRGAVEVAANGGPLAGSVDLDRIVPTARQPWIVQPYLHGREVCTFSVVQRGRVVTHLTYVHPRSLQGAGGITFESVSHPDTLDLTRRLVDATGYHGQLAFDFIETEQGLQVIECNPRPTAGATLLSDEELDLALRDAVREPPYVVPPGRRTKMSLGLIRDMVLNWREMPADVQALFSSAEDVYVARGDVLPAFYALFAHTQVRRWKAYVPEARSRDRPLLRSFFFDICWDGEGEA